MSEQSTQKSPTRTLWFENGTISWTWEKYCKEYGPLESEPDPDTDPNPDPVLDTTLDPCQTLLIFNPLLEIRRCEYPITTCLLEDGIGDDDVEHFLKILKTETKIDVKELWDTLFFYDAVDCVAAILDGQTKGIVDYPPPPDGYGSSVIFMTAIEIGAPKVTNLILDRFPYEAFVRDSKNRLPLNTTINFMSWDCEDPTNLIPVFITLFEWDTRHNLAAARVIAHHTDQVQLQLDLTKYATEGSLSKVATLLLVAPEKMVPICVDLRKQIMEKITSAILHDVRSAMTTGTYDFASNERRMFLQQTLALFEIFEKVGDKLTAYLLLPKDGWKRRWDILVILSEAGISPDNLAYFAPHTSYRSLSDLFVPTSAIEDDDDIPDEAISVLEGLLIPKIEGLLEESICADDPHEFVNLVSNQIKREGLTCNSVFLATELLRSICLHNSVGCAKSLLEGKTDLKVEVNRALEGGIYPLHLAATSLSPSLTELFLRHEAQTYVLCNNISSPYHGMLPLEFALEALCLHHCVGDWMPTKSPIKLIYIFCLPEMVGALKTIELLASDISVVQKISCLCVQQGKFIQLSALLMVAWDMLVSPDHDGNIETSFIGNHIVKKLYMLLTEESKLICSEDTDGVEQVKWKKGGLLFVLSMLEMFKRARSSIHDYRVSAEVKDIANFEVPLEVSNLLRDSGLCLNIDDVNVNDIKCLSRKVESQQLVIATDSEKDGAHPLKPNVAPWASDNHRNLYDDKVEKPDVDFPMLPGCLVSMASRSFQSQRIPKMKDFNYSAQPCLNRLPTLRRQPLLAQSCTIRKWSNLA